MNEKFTQAQNAQVEVRHFQTECDKIKGQIASEEFRINAVHDPIIQRAFTNLDDAKQAEKAAYSEYIVLANKCTDLQAQIQYFEKLRASHPYNFIACMMDIANIQNLTNELSPLEPKTNEAWLIYLDSQNFKESAESNYNAALLAKSNDSAYLDQLKRELIAATDSLNTWKIAYQAATNVYNELKIKLEAIKTGSESDYKIPEQYPLGG